MAADFNAAFPWRDLESRVLTHAFLCSHTDVSARFYTLHSLHRTSHLEIGKLHTDGLQ